MSEPISARATVITAWSCACSTRRRPSHARHFGLDDDEVEQAYKNQFTEVFLEDKVVLEAQQRNMIMAPDATLVDIKTDAPSIATRAMLSELIDIENNLSVASAAE